MRFIVLPSVLFACSTVSTPPVDTSDYSIQESVLLKDTCGTLTQAELDALIEPGDSSRDLKAAEGIVKVRDYDTDADRDCVMTGALFTCPPTTDTMDDNGATIVTTASFSGEVIAEDEIVYEVEYSVACTSGECTESRIRSGLSGYPCEMAVRERATAYAGAYQGGEDPLERPASVETAFPGATQDVVDRESWEIVGATRLSDDSCGVFEESAGLGAGVALSFGVAGGLPYTSVDIDPVDCSRSADAFDCVSDPVVDSGSGYEVVLSQSFSGTFTQSDTLLTEWRLEATCTGASCEEADLDAFGGEPCRMAFELEMVAGDF